MNLRGSEDAGPRLEAWDGPSRDQTSPRIDPQSLKGLLRPQPQNERFDGHENDLENEQLPGESTWVFQLSQEEDASSSRRHTASAFFPSPPRPSAPGSDSADLDASPAASRQGLRAVLNQSPSQQGQAAAEPVSRELSPSQPAPAAVGHEKPVALSEALLEELFEQRAALLLATLDSSACRAQFLAQRLGAAEAHAADSAERAAEAEAETSVLRHQLAQSRAREVTLQAEVGRGAAHC